MYFLGIDSSTQSISACVIDTNSNAIIGEFSIPFQEHLGDLFGIENAILPNEDSNIAHQPPLMWLAGLDLLCADLASSGIDLSKIQAIGGSGQQHGSVYLNSSAEHHAEFTATKR